MKLHRLLTGIAMALPAFSPALRGAEPSGYYNNAEGLSGANLLRSLYDIVTDHTNVGYDGLYDLYLESDVRPEDNTIWDMYSTKHWRPSETCGNYSGVGVCYNREHSFPKSWFGGKVAPMYSDAFHLYPTDGQVNGYRGNNPYGECEGGKTWSNGSVKALGRLGASTFPGYSGTVFEPDDEYKGDFARSYFYMAACYNNRIASWSSPMLAGNSYPAFSSWAMQMLLKWHRQDPVSSKEISRNEAIYGAQHNRNPFIDHPELVEYVWGDKQNESWHSSAILDPAVTSPANGTTLAMGLAAVGTSATLTIHVKTIAATAPVALDVTSGKGFSLSATSVPAATADRGADVVLTFAPQSAGAVSATLTVGFGNVRSTVTVTAEGVDGLPVYEASQITESSFVVRWVNLDAADPQARYTVGVTRDGTPVAGYPRSVEASALSHEVEGLEPSTLYHYTVASATVASRLMSVTTAAPSPMIRFLYDAELNFVTRAGVPSEIAEVLVEIENIADDVTIAVSAPFEMSTDRNNWATEITLTGDDDHFYMRLNAAEAGHYSTSIEAYTDQYFTDEVVVDGVATSALFVETFDADTEWDSYGNGIYQGMAARWRVASGNIWEADNAFNGTPSMRFSASGEIAMDEDKEGGMGVVSADIRKWDNSKDAAAVVALEISDNGGATWVEVDRYTASEPEFVHFATEVKRTGKLRLRLRQIAGKRFNLDNISITDHSGAAASNAIEYHTWNAYCLDGRLALEAGGSPRRLAVYGLDGLTRFDGEVCGVKLLDLPAGLYIVADEALDYTRRVCVR